MNDQINKNQDKFDKKNQCVRVINAANREFAAVYNYAENLQDITSEIAKFINKTGGNSETAKCFMLDSFASFYQNNSELSGYGSTLNQKIIKMLYEDDNFESIRINSSWDEYLSALASIDIGGKAFREVSKNVAEKVNKSDNAENEFNNINQELNDAKELVEQLKKQFENMEDDSKAKVDLSEAMSLVSDLQPKADTANEAAVSAAKAADDSFKGNMKKIRECIKKSAKKTKDKIESMVAIGKMYGSENSPIKGKELYKLTKKMNIEKIRKIADLVGNMTRLAMAKQAAKNLHDVGAIVGIKFGDNVENLMDHELLALSHPILKIDAMARFIDYNLMEFELELKEPLHRGPMVVCADFSGSMAGDNVQCVRAFVLAISNIAKYQKRDFAVIPFNSRAFDPIHFKVNFTDCEWVKSVEEFMKLTPSGGTAFEQPLNSGMDIIESDFTYKKADLILITDGYADINYGLIDRINNRKKESELSVYGVLIGKTKPQTLDKICNKIWYESDLKFESLAVDGVFGAV